MQTKKAFVVPAARLYKDRILVLLKGLVSGPLSSMPARSVGMCGEDTGEPGRVPYSFAPFA
jgi:hypothetical protein